MSGCGEGTINLLTFFALESLRNSPKGIETFYQGIKVLSDINREAIDHMIDSGFTIYTINSTGCNQVSELVNPFNTRIYQSGHYGFGTASAAALGAKFSLDQAYQNGFNDVMSKIIVFAGDGAIYDIGNGPFNYALGENFDITWVIYNNEGYMNTGAQKSGANPFRVRPFHLTHREQICRQDNPAPADCQSGHGDFTCLFGQTDR